MLVLIAVGVLLPVDRAILYRWLLLTPFPRFLLVIQVFSVGVCMYRMLRPDSVYIDNGTGLEGKGGLPQPFRARDQSSFV